MVFDLDKIKQAKKDGIDTIKNNYNLAIDKLVESFEEQVNTQEFNTRLEEMMIDAYKHTDQILVSLVMFHTRSGYTQLKISLCKSRDVEDSIVEAKQSCTRYENADIDNTMSTSIDRAYAILRKKLRNLGLDLEQVKINNFDSYKVTTYNIIIQ